MTEKPSAHKFLNEVHEHAQSAAVIIHELLSGPGPVESVRLEIAAGYLRKALAHIEPPKLFTATNRLFGRPTASQMASASWPSFFPLLRYGVTNWPAIKRTVCPTGVSLRAQ